MSDYDYHRYYIGMHSNLECVYPVPAPRIPTEAQRLLRYRNLQLWLNGKGDLPEDLMREYKELDAEFGQVITTYEEDE